MKQLLLFLFLLSFSGLYASDSIPPFSVKIIDYSLSWTSSMHYTFTDEEMSVVRVDNVDNKEQDILSHRQLLGSEKEKIYRYLSILSQIKFNNEYRDAGDGDRNQKRIIINVNGEEQSVFVSNTYQRDLAGLVSFLNLFVVERNRMKEFTAPREATNK